MNITKKFDRAFQWAGEKMGGEAKTCMTDEFRMLETEMALRHEGMDRLQMSMNSYVKWAGRRGEILEDKEKGSPVSYLGRTMTIHGEDFEPESEFGNCLLTLGRANERIGSFQEHYVADATSMWLEALERNLAMMKEYQTARKKLENRRLAYDASIGKLQKARRDDYRIEEELRANKAKFEESSEDVLRRMQDIKEAEADTVHDLTLFMEAELEYHERCAEELRQAKRNWAARPASNGYSHGHGDVDRRPTVRSRSNTAHSHGERSSNRVSNTRVFHEEPEAEPVRLPLRSRLSSYVGRGGDDGGSSPAASVRPTIGRSNTFQNGTTAERMTRPAPVPSAASFRGDLRPLSRIQTSRDHHHGGGNVFADDADDTTASGSGSPEWGERSASPATSFGSSLNRSTSNLAGAGPGAGTGRKAPPPPPPSRAKKPPPPVPARRDLGY